MATASNSGDSSASRPQVLPSPTLVQNFLPSVPSTELDRYLFSASLAELNYTQHSASWIAPSVSFITTLHGPNTKRRFQQ
jgi:hypothetical protein